MPTTKLLSISDLKLDLNNFRMVHQKNESDAIHAMIAINPDWFWALTESLLADGYHPTENIIVLKGGSGDSGLIVKEGNRRIGALKLIFGHIRRGQFSLPSEIEEQIGKVSKKWKEENEKVPCAIYGPSESAFVDRLVTLTHGKGEKAGRDKWNAVARARHNRDKIGESEPSLDLLEKYLKEGKNITAQQRDRWGGVYPLTVLEEAMKRLAPRFEVASSRVLADQYPKVKYKSGLENILRDIGLEVLGFKLIRDGEEDYAQTRYGIPAIRASGAANSGQPPAAASSKVGVSAHSSSVVSGAAGRKAVSVDDPRAVIRALRKFTPRGNNREKLVTLLKEARMLKLKKHAHSFCFLLRSMFEISAKAYCLDHAASGGPSAAKANGEDRMLVDVLRDITNHLTKNKTDKAMVRALHGAIAELAKSEGFLSVTSMNQLIHNPRFSVDETHIGTLFGNIFPLLEEMNR
jgi:hypothetical protein